MSRWMLAAAAATLICASSSAALADSSGAVTGGVAGAVGGAVVGGPVGAVVGGVGGAAIGIGIATAGGVTAMARNPGMFGKILTFMFVGIALAEGWAVIAWLVVK